MDLYLENIPKSEYVLIPVANQLIKGKITTIISKENQYLVEDFYAFKKGEFIPKGFMKVIMGKEINFDIIWKKYPNSDALVVYVCKIKKNIE